MQSFFTTLSFSLFIFLLSPALFFAIFKRIHALSDVSHMNNTGKRVMSLLFGLLLGDVFLHLMPITWIFYSTNKSYDLFISGLWTIGGLVISIIFQKIATTHSELTNPKYEDQNLFYSNNSNSKAKFLVIKNSGYLAIFVSSLENFCHGLIMGAAFMLSGKLGIFTTLCFLIHEIPYEFRDFVLLMHSGFESYHTLLCQYFSTSWKVIGALLSYILEERIAVLMELWLLPLIGGILLYITLGVIVPLISKERSPKEVSYQFLCICLGIATAGMISFSTHAFPYFQIY